MNRRKTQGAQCGEDEESIVFEAIHKFLGENFS